MHTERYTLQARGGWVHRYTKIVIGNTKAFIQIHKYRDIHYRPGTAEHTERQKCVIKNTKKLYVYTNTEIYITCLGRLGTHD